MVGFETLSRRTRTANPAKIARRRPARSGAKATRKQNPDLITLGGLLAANPHKGARKKMASKKKGAAKPTKNPQAKHRTKNPAKITSPAPVSHKAKKRTSNPLGLGTRATSLLKNGTLALGGLLITRQLPQLALAGNNTGWMGYGANFLTAILASIAADKVSAGAGGPVLIGGGLYLVDRVLTEQFSSAGQILSLNGCGDAKVAVNGTRGLSGVRQGYFPLPVQYGSDGQPIIPAAIVAAAQVGMQPALPAPATGSRTVSGVGKTNRANGNRLLAA